MRVACLPVTLLRAKVEMSLQLHLNAWTAWTVDRDPSKTRSQVAGHFPAACGVGDGMTWSRCCPAT